MLAKIKEYKVGKRGDRGAVISLPTIFLNDHNITSGDIIELYRGTVNGYSDVLVIIPKTKNASIKLNQIYSGK